LNVPDYDFVLFHKKLSFETDVGGLHTVLEVKAGLGITEPGGLDEVADLACDPAESFAEVEAGFHYAALPRLFAC
jgi:hypothetical protein